jgi:HAMP domain-containing protein
LLKAGLQDGATDLNLAQSRIWLFSAAGLLLAIGMTLVFRAAIAGPVVRLTRVAAQIRGGDLEAQAEANYNDETGILAATFNSMTTQLRHTLLQVRKEKRRTDDLLHVVIPIGVDLSAEKDFNRLLEKILAEAKGFCKAQAGVLYLLRAEKKHLEGVIVRNDINDIALGGTSDRKATFEPLPLFLPDGKTAASRQVAVQAAITGEAINIANAYESNGYDFSGPEALTFTLPSGSRVQGQHATSWLAIPLKNNRDDVVGILLLLNARDPESGQIIPFDSNLQQMMESFSSLAVAALEAYMREEGLRQEIQKLRIEIDEVKRQEQVSQIVDSDFFQDLRAKADSLRRSRTARDTKPTDESGEEGAT